MPTLMHEALSVSQPRVAETLLNNVLSMTHRQVRELQIDFADNRVTVSGQSRTYYVKQLVTQAILQTMPSVRLHNNILVAAH